MLYICKDLASKCFDWPGVGRGGRMETSECLKLPKSLVFSRDFGSGPHPLRTALVVTPAKRLNLRLSKSG